MNRKTELRIRHWVFVDDVKFFGPGRYELLGHIEQTGSIAKAAKAMGLSHGGGAVLTETAKRVMTAYKALDDKLLEVAKAEKELLAAI